ncbi:MAG: hypothetical protein O3A63_12710 [Proteobacteria bacterium]|nr:hypothetical protein [Pseudomonadota bacterium]
MRTRHINARLRVTEIASADPLRCTEQLYREVQEGVLKDGAIDDFAGQSLLTTRYFQTGWLRYRRNVDGRFAEYFDAKLSDWMRQRRG